MRDGMTFERRYRSPLGDIVMAYDGEALTGLWFDETGRAGDEEETAPPVLLRTERWLDIYFSGREPDFTPPLRLHGTAFQRRVWAELLKIPYGRTATYGEIARALGASARAVGGAAGRNPVALIVPCHRVVGAGGRLTGYAAGIEKKARLLELEGAMCGEDPSRQGDRFTAPCSRRTVRMPGPVR